MNHKWMQDSALSDIDISKLKQLSALAEQGHHMNQKELLPFLLAAASKSKKQHMNFSSEEVQTILTVLKKNKSSEEQKQIDHLVQMFQQMKNHTSH